MRKPELLLKDLHDAEMMLFKAKYRDSLQGKRNTKLHEDLERMVSIKARLFREEKQSNMIWAKLAEAREADPIPTNKVREYEEAIGKAFIQGIFIGMLVLGTAYFIIKELV